MKKYVAEVGSVWVGETTSAESGNKIFTSTITGAEVVAAVCKRGRTGSITPEDAAKALTAFKSEFRSSFTTINVSDQIIDHAMIVAERHGLRGYDSVQLATAIKLQSRRDLIDLPPLTFVSADDKLNAAAQAEGLVVENPNNHP